MKKWFLLILPIFLLFACGEEDGTVSSSNDIKPQSTGTHSELMIIIDDSLWNSPVGDELIELFQVPVFGLPQAEPHFHLVKLDEFNLTPLLKRTKSILYLKVIPDSTGIATLRNVWAAPQMVAYVIAPSKKELVSYLRKVTPELIKRFDEHDREVLAYRLKKSSMKSLPSELKKMGIKSWLLPESFDITLNKPGLIIMRSDNLKTNQNIIVSSRPMDNSIVPGPEILTVRDSILKHYFEGASEGSYLTTETLISPQQTNVEIDGKFAIETRGLWKTVGDFMGGPFISYTIFDEANKRILTVDAFVYGPKAKKRNLMLEIETSLRSIKLD